MILTIDNYDSFTYNLVQALEATGARVRVVRNDALDRAALDVLAAGTADPLRGIVVSPGPGDPRRAGVSLDAIALAAEQGIPLLGVCLGMQALAFAFGASVVRAPSLVHGEASLVSHDGRGLLEGMPSPFAAARYHSLCVDAQTLPPVLEVSATADDGVVMGIRHRLLPLEGVQFHPESVLTPDGPRILARFLRACGEGNPTLLDERSDFAFRGLAA